MSDTALPQFKGRAGWEFTDISKLDFAAYPDAGEGEATAADGVERIVPDFDDAIRIVQVDATTVVLPDGLPDGVTVAPLAQARLDGLVPDGMPGALMDEDRDAFTKRNAADLRGGLFVHVAKGVQLEQPIQMTVVQSQVGTTLNQRTLVVVEEGAQAEVWDQALSSSDDLDALMTTIVELHVGDGANLRYIGIQGLSERSWVFGVQQGEVGRDGNLDWVALGFGAAKGRVRMASKLAGKGANGKLTGAYASRGRQHLDFDTFQEHSAENTTSDLAFRGVLDDRATSVWSGMIRVDPGAQQTDAFQESRNLLLSRKAHADAIPGLEIEADDVRCTHAAAIAQLDEEQIFYLRARGLPEPQARRLVIEGFLAELVERFDEGRSRDALAVALDARLNLVLGA
ncbi:MAG: Fe-S cluster assembly protein SufD [Actinomycetes bacterium]